MARVTCPCCGEKTWKVVDTCSDVMEPDMLLRLLCSGCGDRYTLFGVRLTHIDDGAARIIFDGLVKEEA